MDAVDDFVDRRPRDRTQDFQLDVSWHLAKVRVAGSNLVVRSRWLDLIQWTVMSVFPATTALQIADQYGEQAPRNQRLHARSIGPRE